MTEQAKVSQHCKIVNPQGLHTRSAAAIVQLASRFPCTMTLSTEKGESEASDMLRLMLLEATFDTDISIAAVGEQAQEAVNAMLELVVAGFGEI